ncbi:MAG TPA: glycoside hydrolase family 88 protein [Candidatus Methylacidiphilales bacterium]|nr:glycoside hydrolase family 88 protein [Candidatus Methylacidiphilales bacterium]
MKNKLSLFNLPRFQFPRIIFALLPALLISGSTQAVRAADMTDAEIRDVINRVAHHQIHPLKDGAYPAVSGPNAAQEAQAATPPDGIAWSYPWGVTLFGMLRSTDITGDKDVAKFVLDHNLICSRYYNWLNGLRGSAGASALTDLLKKNKIGPLMHLGNLDSCGSMGNQMLEGMIRYPDQVTPEEKAVVNRIADWVVNKQDRLPDGTLWRSKNMGGTIWPDDLYMGGVFLVRWAKYTGDQKYLDDAAHQIINQAALTQDKDGLWFHGYFVSDKQHAPFKWGRGNGWVTVTLVETLSDMPANDPLRPQLLDILRRQIEGLKKVQAPDGMWRQVLDQPQLWEETSCTAMFAYGIARAVNRGWIDPSNMAVARKAFAAIAKNEVTPDGVVKGTCEGTNIGKTLDFYAKRGRPDDDLHGRGVTLLAGTELLLAHQK